MRKRFFLAAVLAALWASAGCEAWHEHWCAKHGYCRPVAAPAYGAVPPCCVPCPPCAPAAYAPAAASGWNAPAAAVPPPPPAGTCTCPPGTVPVTTP
jgi:hypothetical protein